MPTVSALEFQRKFGRFQHEAQREPVEITRHGCREFVLMSAEQYDWLRASYDCPCNALKPSSPIMHQ